MNKWLSVVAIVVLCLALVIGAACGEGEEDENGDGDGGVTEIKFGFGVPLTGPIAGAMGLPAKYAFTLAAEKIGEFEVAGKTYRWKPIFEDNTMDTAGGVASATKFIFEHDVDFMFQAGLDPGLSASDLCEEKGMILDIAGGSWENFGPEKPHMFQIAATWGLGTVTFFDWLSREHPEVKRVVAAHGDDIMGYQQADAVKACCEYYGLELKSVNYPYATVEYYPMATSLMAFDPDLAIGNPNLLGPMWDMGYEGLAMTSYWLEALAELAGWDRCEGYLIIMPHPLGDPWPETIALKQEYEDRYGMELVPAAWWTFMVESVMTDVLKQAGTVDDIDRIIEVMESGASFDSPVGPLYYGLQELNGIGHVSVWPSPIYQVAGEEEYRVVALYTPDEVEALAIEVYK